MGHIAYQKNHFNCSTFVHSLYHNVDFEKRKSIIFFMIKWSLFVKHWVPFTKLCFVPSLVEIDPMVLQEKIFRFRHCIFALLLLSPLGKGRGSTIEKIWIHFTQGCFVPSLVEIDPVVPEKHFFFINFLNVFSLFRNCLP